MPLTQDHRDEIGMQLTRQLGKALREGTLAMDQVPDLVDYILEKLAQIATHEELIKFLMDLNERWSSFDLVLTSEKTHVQKEEDLEKAAEVEQLISEKKLDEALQKANTQ